MGRDICEQSDTPRVRTGDKGRRVSPAGDKSWEDRLGGQAVAQTQGSGTPCRKGSRESDPNLYERRVSHHNLG